MRRNTLRTIGLIGGMSWETSALYYRWVNEGVKERLDGLHSAEIVVHSGDFACIGPCEEFGRGWRLSRKSYIRTGRC